VIANHIHDALEQVRTLQEFILEKRLFRGYSGAARLAAAAAVLLGTCILASDRVPRDPQAHLIGWGVVCGVALLVNYLFLLYWFLFDEGVRRNPVMLKPALDAFPALIVGAALSAAVVRIGAYDCLFGVWMCLYGLAQAAYRQALPPGVYALGLGYIACGIYCLLSPHVSFVNPWPMGVVFFLGEAAGGYILLMRQRAYRHRQA